MNIKKTTKYSLLAIGVLTTFQLGQVKASADSFENSNESRQLIREIRNIQLQL